MEQDKMVRQINQIAAYFEVYPEDRAETGIRGHIEKFMAPSLRRQLADYAASDGSGLRPLALRAVQNLEINTS